MLELSPTCEHCNKALPHDSLEARICFLWVHHMRLLCRTRPGECLPKLLWWVRPSTGSVFDESERGQLLVKRSGEHQGDTPTGGFCGACPLLGQDQDDPIGETIGS